MPAMLQSPLDDNKKTKEIAVLELDYPSTRYHQYVPKKKDKKKKGETQSRECGQPICFKIKTKK